VADTYQIKNQIRLYFLTLQVVGWEYIYSSAKKIARQLALLEIDEQ
jgi:hypothetical protein